MIRNTKIVDQTFSHARKKSSSTAKSEFSHVRLNELKQIGTLGVGGFGRVELVQFKGKATFALKSLKKIEMLQQQQQEHAYNEKEILFACDSPFIVR
jgi:cGMP-dependent protein kinase 1